MTLIAQYEDAVLRADIQNDPLQREVILHLQRVADDLAASRPRWCLWRRKSSVNGLYLYGPVGVGKTYLVDLFYEYVDEPRKSRFHFHHFMQQVDAQLRHLQGQKDPLRRIAAELAKTTRLLCFDEFLVHDVADAMILAELLQAILSHGVVLVATSNTPPDDLYLNGVQRDRFLPAIQLIKQHCQVWALTKHCDYRTGRMPLQEAYLYPLNNVAEETLTQQFSEIARGEVFDKSDISVQHRFIPTVKCSENVVWFCFDVICNLPRSQLDYLEIAARFESVFVSGIPKLTNNEMSRVILLIHFVDVMYDQGIRLVVSAAVPLLELYQQGAMLKEFKRTLSRLEEMQSEDYLRRHHRRQLQSLSQENPTS